MDLSPFVMEHQVYMPKAITFSKQNNQPKRLPNSSRKETFKSLKSKEIDNAQTKARHIILQSQLEGNKLSNYGNFQGNFGTCSIESENAKSQADGFPSVNAVKIVNYTKPNRKVSSKITKGKGECNMRFRQVTKLINQICDCIEEIDVNYNSTKTITKEFMSPYELQVKEKRLEDFLYFGRRILLTLKREINHLSSHVTIKKNNFKWFRRLSTVSRTLYQLLLGLKNHSDIVICNSVHLIFYEELLHTSCQLFTIVSTIGIKFTNQDILKKLNLKFSKRENTDEGKPSATNSEHSIDSSSDSLYSSLDDACLALLHPRNMRRRIATLARVSLLEKKDKMKESEIMVLAPLNLTRMAEELEPKQKKDMKRTKKNFKTSSSQRGCISHSSNTDQIEILSETHKNILPTRPSFSCNNMESKHLELDNQKELFRHTIERDRKKDIMQQKKVLPVSLITQINYLNERVYKINEEWEEIEKDIEEIRSHAHEEYFQVTHQIILNEAQKALIEPQIDLS